MNQITLRDPATHSAADILVGFGFNCYRFQTELDGQTVDVIWAADQFETERDRPSGSGIPVLFPFPGRIQGLELQWNGRRYPLEEGDGLGNAIHGFVHHRPWRIVAQDESRVVATFHAATDAPELLERWPSDFQITGSYQLQGRCLSSEFTVENPGSEPLPFGFGVHPYFRLPLLPRGRADECLVSLPVGSQWKLHEMNATGEKEPVADLPRVQSGRPFGELYLDNVFGDLQSEAGETVATIEDASSGAKLMVRFSEAFRACVVYTPDHREAICIEPYTCVPDAFRLAREGIDAGLRQLQPGEKFSARVSYELISAVGR